jgi:membrane-associated protease RseP (regulator of RpoE activity)
MVDPLLLVLAGVALYTLAALALKARGYLPPSVKVSGPITTLHTKRGRAFLDWLASPGRFWRAWGNFGVGIALVVMAGMFIVVLQAGLTSVFNPQPATPVNEPQNVLVIPGVNDFLPLAAAPSIVLGLLVGLVVHEGGHGLLCRVEDIDIDSMGLAFLAFVPVGAFVEPDEESRRRADRGAQTRMFAAGVTNNFLVSLVGFLLLFGPITAAIVPVAGVPVGDTLSGSAANETAMEFGDVVTEVDGKRVTSQAEMDATLANTTDRQVTLGLESGDSVTVDRYLIVTRAVPSAVPGIDLRGEEPPRVETVDDEEIYTEGAFRDHVRDDPVVNLTTDRGSTEFVAGAYVARVAEDGAFADSEVPTDADRLVVTRVDGERVVSAEALGTVLDQKTPGDEVTVEAYVDGERRTYEVTLGGSGEDAVLGVQLRRGVGGIVLEDTGVDAYPAGLFLDVLGGNVDLGGSGDFVRAIGLVLFLPFISALGGGIDYNFAGFNGPVQNFYTVQGPLSVLDGGTFVLANAVFWTAWVNIQLGLFNCVPSFPLDGGHILRTSTESIVSRIPVGNRRALVSMTTTVVSLSMLAGLFLMIFGPRLFS